MKLHRARLVAFAITIVVAACMEAGIAPDIQAQTSANLVGSWRADTPLPSGVVQTFRFGPDGSFDLIVAVAVDGQYRVDGNKLIETVTLPGTGVAGTDTAVVLLRGDSLVLGGASASGGKILRRPPSTSTPAASGILGDWVIMLPNGMAASYRFDPDGTLHIRAQVSDERGTYTVKGNTLRLTSERTFQLPATSNFSVSDSVLTLTPPSGQGARGFHKVSAR